MKRIYSTLAAALISVNILGLACKNVNGQNTADKPISVTIQSDIYKIFQNSCVDCHAKGGKNMAMSHVNFSEWDNYPAEKKAKKAADIVGILKKGKMPPKLYRESHPETIPTPAQVDSIVKWADSLPKN